MEHEPTEVTVTTPATCTEKGEEECYCAICDGTYTRPIPSLGHELDENGKCTREGCDYSVSSVGGTFKVDDCWEQYNNKPSFDTFSLTCEVLTASENGENGTVAVTGWSGAEGNTKTTGIYILIPPTVTDDFGNTYDVTEVTANFQMNASNQQKGELLGFYLKAPMVKELTVNSMFLGQSNMKVLDLGSTLEVIGVGCFSGCKKIDSTYAVVLPETLKEIGIGAFKGVPFSGKNEDTLDIPESVTYIGTGAFESSNLKTVTGGEGITRLESTVFQDCWLLKSVEFPNVTEFESAVFYNSGLNNVGWDWSKITVLDDDTFGGCYGLIGDLVLSGDCELGLSTFSGTGFSSITIGEGITEIPNWAFYGCFNLTEVNLPNSLTTIGEGAFGNAGYQVAEGQEDFAVEVTIGSDDGSRLSEVKSDAFAEGNFNITVNTSEDSIANTTNLEGFGNTVNFTVASIETTKTADDLQTLINEAESGATIDLTESYDINAKVTVPEGKSVTLTSSNGSGLKGTVSGYMFDVPATAGLALGEGLTAMVRNTRLVESAGTFTLAGADVTGGSAGMNQGVVHITAGGVFIMNGGSVTGNSAVNGGGIYSHSRAVKLLAGNIENNTASSLGGGMYVSTNPYSIELGDVLITGNSAEVMGGGIWSCPIGTVDFVNGTFAIYGNSAEKAGDDVAALNKKTNTITTLGDNMPGGGVMAWYKDGSISAVSMDGNDLGAILGDSVRYAEGDIRIEAPVKSEKSFSAKSIVTDDAASLVSASLIIRGNKASQGGGIGSNGIVKQNGESLTPSEITVNKVWSGSGEHPDSVTVELTATKDDKTIVLDRAVLSEDNKWTYTFKYAPLEGMVYGVREIVPEGYESTVSTDEDTGAVTITNTKKSPPDDDTDDPDVPPDDDEDIDDPDVPTDDGEDIDDPDVPLDDGEDIEDPDVPLGDLPHTGTTPFSANKAATVMMILAAVLTLSGAAAAFAGRRKEQ